MLHPPQLPGLVSRSAQNPPQLVSPVMHPELPQRLATHICPLGHALLQRPQWPGSLVVSAQYPEQLVRPVGHMTLPVSPAIIPPSGAVTEHRLFTQNCPVGQAMPHPPQWPGSFVVLAQYPPPQLVVPVGHVPVPVQRPDEHVCPEAQRTLHPPQLNGSFDVLAQ